MHGGLRRSDARGDGNSRRRGRPGEPRVAATMGRRSARCSIRFACRGGSRIDGGKRRRRGAHKRSRRIQHRSPYCFTCRVCRIRSSGAGNTTGDKRKFVRGKRRRGFVGLKGEAGKRGNCQVLVPFTLCPFFPFPPRIFTAILTPVAASPSTAPA